MSGHPTHRHDSQHRGHVPAEQLGDNALFVPDEYVLTKVGDKGEWKPVPPGGTHDHDADYEPLGTTHAAEDVTFDNTASGLVAEDVQAAIDEHLDGHGTGGGPHDHDGDYEPLGAVATHAATPHGGGSGFLEGEADPSAGAGVEADLGTFYIRKYEAP